MVDITFLISGSCSLVSKLIICYSFVISYEQKRERTYQKWQEFKEHQKEERLAQLKKKTALQHELIRARDERHLQLIFQEEQRLAEVGGNVIISTV